MLLSSTGDPSGVVLLWTSLTGYISIVAHPSLLPSTAAAGHHYPNHHHHQHAAAHSYHQNGYEAAASSATSSTTTTSTASSKPTASSATIEVGAQLGFLQMNVPSCPRPKDFVGF